MFSTSYHRTKWTYADELLNQFVADFANVYNQELINSNAHILLHVLEDVEKFSDLSIISAYDFEARLHDINQLVQTGRYSSAQAVNRVSELQQLESTRLIPVVPILWSTVKSVGHYTQASVRPGFTFRL
uniref:Uncharacterized protein n=1 Tax=Anopheles melas TaxID=34690 RepID=A0A182TTF1_9DIPT